ncbi:MAG: rhodanese-like domain-containing protein [Verrucomicrobiia bacterium]
MGLLKKIAESLLSLLPGGGDVKNITADEFQSLLNEKDAIALDVRTSNEFSRGRIKGAINVDFLKPDFENKISKFDREKKYLVYCASGGRSAAACKQMSRMGFKNCYNLKGGFSAWKRSGKPVM